MRILITDNDKDCSTYTYTCTLIGSIRTFRLLDVLRVSKCLSARLDRQVCVCFHGHVFFMCRIMMNTKTTARLLLHLCDFPENKD